MNEHSDRERSSTRGARSGEISVALLALGASLTSAVNGFAVDDRSVIEVNANVHGLAHWWRLFGEGYWPASAQAGLYRPVTTLAFAVQWTLGGGAPAVFHAMSIVLYVVVSLLVYRLARRLAGQTVGWISGAVFAVHPVHVEAVGNVVGQSELIAALAVLAATLLYARAVQENPASPAAFSPGQVAVLAVLYAVGIFSKESAIVLPALLAIMHVYLWRSAPTHGSSADAEAPPSQARRAAAAVRPVYLVLIAVALAAVWARTTALGDTTVAPNTALDGLTMGQRTATMLGVVPEWLRLFVWPVRLIPVYSPPYIRIARALDAAAVPGFLLVVAFVVLTIAAARRAATRAVALGLAWMAIALAPVSNILIPTGILLAERTLFLPSVGFAFAVGAAAAWAYDRARARTWAPALLLAGGVLVTAAMVRSAIHQRVWSDDGHLITAAVTAAPDSYMLDAMYADYALRTGKVEVAKQWLDRAIALYPNDPSTYISLGQLYVQVSRFDRALLAFTFAMRLDRTNADARAGMIVSLDRLGRYSEARQMARGGIAAGGDDAAAFRRLLALTDSMSAQADSKTRH